MATVQSLVQQEDRRRPLTDDELAARLGLRRDQVTVMRQQLGIPDSRERRRQALAEAIHSLQQGGSAQASDRELTRLLNEQGFDVSRQVVTQVRHEVVRIGNVSTPIVSPPPTPAAMPLPTPEPAPQAPQAVPLAFDRLVGVTGSLRPIIEQVRAAVLYPPHGLHTLILGPTGSGKSELAKAMFEFAQSSGRMPQASRFVAFNCADYAENPQLLVSTLFGVTKGAYTGATTDRPGLVEQASGGILFLDEVHRLPPDGQEILYHLIDHGSYRRLGETESHRKARVMIVAATTEEVDSALLLPFRRRIPMVVRLPSLADRPLSERLECIERVLAEESSRTDMPIRCTLDAAKAFLLYDCPGNLGGLRSDIQVSCARAFVASVTAQRSTLSITHDELPPHVARGLLHIEGRRRELESLLNSDLSLVPGQRPVKHMAKDTYVMPGEVYDYVERRHGELIAKGLSDSERGRVLVDELESRLQAFIRRVQTAPLAAAQTDLTGVVGETVMKAASRMTEIAGRRIGVMDDRLLYCLATHLSAALERIREGHRSVPPQLPPALEQREEYAVAREMVAAAEQALGLDLPREEVGYVALYLRSFSGTDAPQPRVGVVVISHGRVAGAMAEVANRLLGVSHARSVEMSLDEPPEQALERAQQAALEADEGLGVLLLADMGSLVTFGPLITSSTGVATRTVERVDTAVVLDAVRRAMLPGATLDEVAAALPGLKPEATTDHDRPRAILAVCITGQGAALRIREMVKQAAPDVPVYTDGLISPERLHSLAKRFEIIATVGTVDPGLPGVPFIPYHEMLHGSGSARLRLLAGSPLLPKNNGIRLKEVLDPALLLPQAPLHSKQEVLATLAGLLVRGGYARPGFLDAVWEREGMGPVVLGPAMAIPHTDPTQVRRPGVAVAVLERPLDWGEGRTVSVVCMLALTAESGNVVLDLNEIASQPLRLEQLRGAITKQEMMEVLGA
ncbi:MAG: sigma 54-interacting transcriptional regulator [Mycobacterium leprae]